MFRLQNQHNGEDWQEIPGSHFTTKGEAFHAARCLSADTQQGMVRVMRADGVVMVTFAAGSGREYLEKCERELKERGEFYNTQLGEPWEPREPESLKVARKEAEKAREAANKRTLWLAEQDYRPDGLCQQLEADAIRLEALVKKMEQAEVRFEIPEGARSALFDQIVRKYGPKPEPQPIKLRQYRYTLLKISEPDVYDTNSLPGGELYPGEREFLLRTSARPRSSFQDLVGDYFRPVFLRHLWFTYYA